MKYSGRPFFAASGPQSRTYTEASIPASAVASRPPLHSFTLFPQLPPEIRGPIWKLIALHPRLIHISPFPSPDYLPPAKPLPSGKLAEWRDPKYSVHWKARAGVPITLAVCRESRAETISQFELCFSSQFGREVYYSPLTDVLFFNDVIDVQSFCVVYGESTEQARDRRLVRRIALFSQEQGLDDFSRWVQERNVKRQQEVYENINLMLFVYRAEAYAPDGLEDECAMVKLKNDCGALGRQMVDYGEETIRMLYVEEGEDGDGRVSNEQVVTVTRSKRGETSWLDV